MSKRSSNLKQTCLYAIILGELSVVLGICIAYELNMPPGGVVVMIALLQLIAIILLGKTRLDKMINRIHLHSKKSSKSLELKL
ncbi:metal ABC transporter permease [Bacillus sp. DJP31]|uniref:metal ABC transporter permease n=1 Tax=Bacillus sp. DJP31 TaxID=3409789 RepID=UPI003BB49806